MKLSVPLATLCLLLPLAARAQNPVQWKLISPRSIAVASGGIASVRIEAKVQKGWRVYSLTQEKGGPYGMTIMLVPGSRVKIAGTIKSPVPATKYDSSFKMKTETYSGSTGFIIPLRAPASSGSFPATIKVRYQACSARFCLPPRNALLPITLRVRPEK